MKLASYAVIAGLLLATPALAQGVIYKEGDRVEALHTPTGNWISATIIRISADRYMLHADNAAIQDWDVGIGEIRGPGAASSRAAQPEPAAPSMPPRSESSSTQGSNSSISNSSVRTP